MGIETRKARILVVDDDEDVRDYVCEVLAEQGHHVTAVKDGVEALGALQQVGASFELLVTDIVMPGLNGFSLASLVKARWPGTKILYITGFYDIAQSDLGERYGAVLQKPFRPRQLNCQVSRALTA
jgi:two-component system cell cycle response regulator CpdR